jgi:hypothetical protein
MKTAYHTRMSLSRKKEAPSLRGASSGKSNSPMTSRISAAGFVLPAVGAVFFYRTHNGLIGFKTHRIGDEVVPC